MRVEGIEDDEENVLLVVLEEDKDRNEEQVSL